MRSREVESLARTIVAGCNLSEELRVEVVPGLRRKGVVGDIGKYGKVVFLIMTSPSYTSIWVHQAELSAVASRIWNTIEDVVTVLVDVTHDFQFKPERFFTAAS